MDVKRLCRMYVGHAQLIGALYCIFPVLLWFGTLMVIVPFREVYLLRLVLALFVGSIVAAYANTYGVRMWLIKHQSPAGPATAWDGVIIGACVGMAVTFLPPLTSLIATNHLEQAKWFIIGAWLVSIVNGIWIGALAGRIGSKRIAPEEALDLMKKMESRR